MGWKNAEARRAYDRKWSKANPGKRWATIKKWKAKQQKLSDEYKLSRGCLVCGYKRCAKSLDYHHRDSKEKELTISVAIVRYGRSFESLASEVAKCDVMCKNCHTELHEGLIAPVAQ